MILQIEAKQPLKNKTHCKYQLEESRASLPLFWIFFSEAKSSRTIIEYYTAKNWWFFFWILPTPITPVQEAITDRDLLLLLLDIYLSMSQSVVFTSLDTRSEISSTSQHFHVGWKYRKKYWKICFLVYLKDVIIWVWYSFNIVISSPRTYVNFIELLLNAVFLTDGQNQLTHQNYVFLISKRNKHRYRSFFPVF